MGVHLFCIQQQFDYYNIMFALLFLPLVLGGNIPEPYGFDYSPKCKRVEKVIHEDICEPYVKKTCFTEVIQKCKDIVTPNCTAVIDVVPDQECFTVEDVDCDLVEHMDVEVVPETYFEQRCFTEQEEVCDVVNQVDMDHGVVDDCIEVERSDCWEEEKVVKDRECCFSVELDCKKTISVKGHKQQCQKRPTKDCKDIPRTVYEEKCRPRVEKVCEKLRYLQPFPVPNQKCVSKPVKRCVVEEKSKPKKLKNFVYSKECKPVPRKVCEKADREVLRETCDQVVSQVCKYKPSKHCTEGKLEHCYKADRVVHEEVCEHDHGY